MQSRVLLFLVAVIALSVFIFACGDSDGGNSPTGSADDNDRSEDAPSSEIRTARGDGVQAMVAEFSGSGGGGGGGDASGSLGMASAGGAGVGGGGVGNVPASGGGTKADSAAGADTLQQDGSGGITVQGYGSAEQDADGAILEFSFNRNGNYNYSPTVPAPSPVKEEDLQQVIDALVNAGVPRDSIELASNSYYYDYYSPVFLRATLDNLDILSAAAEAGRSAGTGISGLYFQNVTVTYTVDDCTSLREAALEEAVADADERGGLLAAALDVGSGPVSAASDYSWWGYGSGNCGQSNNYYGYYYGGGGVTYVEGQPQEVQVFESISVTYTIQ